MKRILGLIFMGLFFSNSSYAKTKLECYEEPGTRAATCYDANSVTANGNTRAAYIYTGGPNGVRKTNYLFVTNCANGISTLQDRDGVNFAGNLSSATPLSRSLSQWICEVRNTRKNSNLRQF